MSLRPVVLAAGAVVVITAVSACSSAAAHAPNWSPQPEFSGDGGGSVVPALPGQPLTTPSQAPAGGGTSSPPSGSPTPAGDPNVVATHLAAPIGLTMLPDGTALVGERTTGRIVRVQPSPGQPVQTIRTIGGIDAHGDGGLLDLTLSPTYAEDNLIFAYVTTATDNRVVDFTLHGPMTPVLTGIPRGSTGNAGRILFGGDGDLYVGTGDAGNPANVTDPRSLAGKILRVTSIGRPAPGNPTPGSPIYLTGSPEVDGLCANTDGSVMLETVSRPTAASDTVNDVGTTGLSPLRPPPATGRGVGGCAIESNVLYVASRDGQALLGTPLATAGALATAGPWTLYLAKKYGRLRTVVAAQDGALWLTTSNRDGHGKPVADDERVLRIQPPAGGASHSPV